MKNNKPISLIISLAVSLGTGLLAALLTSGSMEVYDTIYRPPLAPPAWLFPVAWTILYTLMGIAAYLVYESDNADSMEKRKALILYALQLVVNFLWPVIFFNMKMYLFAFVWILLLWYLVYYTYKSFKEINRAAGLLLVPYLVWLTFAAYLNLAIVIGNT